MQIGVVGLGRMDANSARGLMNAGHASVVWDASRPAIGGLGTDGATITRFRSRQQHTFAENVLAATRFGFEFEGCGQEFEQVNNVRNRLAKRDKTR